MKIHWWTGNGCRDTCHMNKPGLNFKESLLGSAILVNEKWYIEIEGVEGRQGPFKHLKEARETLEAAVGGEPITNYD